MKTDGFVVISCSKLDPYQDVRTCNKQLTQWIFFVIYCKLRNICLISFVVASLSKLARYDKMYTTCVLYFDNLYFVISTNIFLRITFRQIWTDLF